MSTTQQLAKRNQLVAYVITVCENASFSLPIWLLFFTRQIGLSVTAAIALSIVRWVAMSVSNIPTGALADRFGRVRLFRLGQPLYALTYLPFLFTKNLPVLVVAQLLGGLFGAMTIGTMQPLVQDGHILANLPKQMYKNYLSTDTALLYSSRLLAGIFGAWLYSRYSRGPYILEFIVLFTAFLTSLFLHEHRIEKPKVASNRKHMSEAIRYIWKYAYLRYFFAVVLLATLATESMWTALQPYFLHRGIAPQYFGVLFGIVALMSALGALLSRKMSDEINGIRIYACCIAATIVSVLLAIVHSKWLVPVALLPMGFSFGFMQPTRFATIQKHTSSKYQSTVLSASSLSTMLFYSIASILVGRYVDLFGTATMLKVILVQACVCMLLVGVLGFVAHKNK